MAERPPVQVSAGGSDRPLEDVLVSGSDRKPVGPWRRLPRGAGAALAAVAAAGACAVVLGTGVGRPAAVPPLPLAALGPAVARVDDGGLLVRVEAELRSREPVVLRRGTVTGGGLVVLVDPAPSPAPGSPDAVTLRVVAVLDPQCSAGEAPGRRPDAVLQVVVAPQDGGEAATLSSGVPARGLDAAVTAACAPVRASVALPSGSGPAVRELEVSATLAEGAAPVQLLALTGRGLAVDLAGRALPTAVAGGPTAGSVRVTAPVAVTDCAVGVLAPRGLVLEARQGNERLRVPVDAGPGVVAGLDELVRQTCRRSRL